MTDRIRLLCTSDIHGTVYPYRYDDRTEADHGVARLKTLIDRMRDAQTIVIDNGDTIEGSPLTFFHYMHEKDRACPVSKVMRLIGYDYVNIGNHDFNEGQEALFRHLETVGAPCITSNFIYRGMPYGPPYVIREIAGRRLALFGLTTQYIPHWESEAHLKDITFTDACETAKKTVEALRALPEDERPDYIVCVYHGGFECDPESGVPMEKDTGENEGYRILTEVPEIDVLLTGHQHRTYCGRHGNTVYTQPAAGGKYLAAVDILVSTGEIIPSLLEVKDAPDEEVLREVQPEEDACQAWLDTAIGHCAMDLKITNEHDARVHKSQVITFLNMVQTDATGADLSASALFLHATGFEKEITMRDLVSTYVFPNTLVVKRITGRTLRAYLERCAAFWALDDEGRIIIDPQYDFPTPGHYNYDMVDGITYTIRVSGSPGERIELLQREGQDVRDDDTFTIAVNNYRAAGSGGFEMIAESETVAEYPESMVELIASYIIKNPVLDFAPVHNITVIP